MGSTPTPRVVITAAIDAKEIAVTGLTRDAVVARVMDALASIRG